MALVKLLCPCLTPATEEREGLVADGESSPAQSPALFGRLRAMVAGGPDPLAPHWDVLGGGATLNLNDEPCEMNLSSDKTLLTWRSLRRLHGQPVVSGALALSTINSVEAAKDGYFVSANPGEFTVSADGQELTVVAESAQQRGEWVSALRVVSEKAATSRAELSMTSKLTYDARRRMEIENKRRDAERRKAEIMKNGGMVGMKHTARAMASR